MLSQPRLSIDASNYINQNPSREGKESGTPTYTNPRLGSKTNVLFLLSHLGIPVPQFLAVPTDSVEKLWPGAQERKQMLESLLSEVESKLPAARYAVRSSALNEDSQHSALAGLFHSEIDVPAENLASAINAVIEQASQSDHTSSSSFSLIIQEYIEADFSGVIFSRDPFGGRQMIIEFAKGACQQVVSGQAEPMRLEFYHSTQTTERKEFDCNALLFHAKILEQYFSWPQDIEWCWSKGQLWILQSRAITSLSAHQYEGMRYLDSLFTSDQPQLFERSGVSEIAPRPCSMTLSLIELLYAADGPVAKAYRTHGLHYRSTNFLRLIGNELFVDCEAERRSLFPTLSLNSSGKFQHRNLSVKNILLSSLNSFSLLFVSFSREDSLRSQLIAKLQKPFSPTISFEQALSNFLEDYEIIFEINLLAGIALNRFTAAIKSKESEISLSESLASEPAPELHAACPKGQYVGNSLDFMDSSAFTPLLHSQPISNEDKHDNFEKVGGLRHAYILDAKNRAARFSKLREAGRWLSVLHINQLRTLILNQCRSANLTEAADIFWFTLQEVQSHSISQAVAEERKLRATSNSHLLFPNIVGSCSISRNCSNSLGVSPGIAEGTLTSPEQVGRKESESSLPIILLVDALTPDLVQYFPKVVGIVARRGGVLSHLAIMAREYGLPVIITNSIGHLPLDLRDKVRINGSQGSIEVIKSLSKTQAF